MTPTAPAYLGRLQPLACGRAFAQAELTAWLAAGVRRAHADGARDAHRAAALYQRLLGSGVIAQRHSVLPDFASLAPRDWVLFRESCTPDLARRMRLFEDEARRIVASAFAADEAPPPAALQVTCTGYEAPTALQRHAAAAGWGEAAKLLHLGHMGCFAALPAAALAARLARELGRASVVHVELCTLHLALDAVDPDQVVIHHLFADGAMRYDLADRPLAGPGFALVDAFEAILPDSAEAMTWRLTGTGFRMTLAREVPQLVADTLPGLVGKTLARHGLHRGDVAHWAIHPGGSRIIDGVARCLELEEPQIAHSRAVLRERGNMSSATVPHIWAALAEDPAVPDGTHVVTLAFGPGLTVTGNLLRKVTA